MSEPTIGDTEYQEKMDALKSLIAVVEELLESAAYWSEYDVPLGIVDRMRTALAKAKGEG